MQQSLVFSQFVGSMLTLDKSRYETIQANPETQTLSPIDKLKLFSDDFQASVAELWSAHESYQNAYQRLARAIFGIVKASACTFDEASKVLSIAFGSTYSKQHLSKAYSVGEQLDRDASVLQGVTDSEKMYMISTLSPEVQAKVLSEANPISTPRAAFAKVVQAHSPKSEPTPIEVKPPNLNRALKQIEALAHDIGGVDAEIAQAIERLKSLVSARIEASKPAVETKVG